MTEDTAQAAAAAAAEAEQQQQQPDTPQEEQQPDTQQQQQQQEQQEQQEQNLEGGEGDTQQKQQQQGEQQQQQQQQDTTAQPEQKQQPSLQQQVEQQQQQQQQLLQQLLQQQQAAEELSSEQSRLILDEIERRIALCEAAAGINPNELIKGGVGAHASKSPKNLSLILSLCSLQQQTAVAMRGSLAEVLAKYSELKVWLEGGPVSAARLLLTLHAKRELVLQQEELLLATAAKLRSLETLQQYVNPPCLSDLADYKRRMHALEVKGNEIAICVAKIENKIQHLAHTYNTTMNMMSSVFQEWQMLLNKREGKTEAAKDI